MKLELVVCTGGHSEARVVGLYRLSHVVKIKQTFPSWLQL